MRAVVSLSLTTAVMCADPSLIPTPDAEAPEDSAPGATADALTHDGPPEVDVEASEVRYHLAWDWGDAVTTDHGWRVTTDLGYDVEVATGYLVTASVQLAPCTDEDLDTGMGWRGLLGSGRAWAGHGSGEEDPSAWLVGVVESVSSPETLSLAPISLDEGIYCRTHYLVSRATTGADQLPEDMDLVGTSLYIIGTATAPSGDPTPFSVWSSLPVGELMSWSEPVSPVDLSSGSVDVTITRDLGRLFDGVAFATMSSENIEKTMLLGLINRLRVELTAP